MRFRTDKWHWADLRNHQNEEKIVEIYGSYPEIIAQIRATEPALPGDVWRMHWRKDDGNGPIAGYAIYCLAGKHVHCWTTSSDCPKKREYTFLAGHEGKEMVGATCEHVGVSSCWDWTGSAEENTLTANPSLVVTSLADHHGECNFHGWLQNGKLRGC